MANLVEVDNYDAGIYQLETTDPVQGGAGGIDNAQAQSLANRTKHLKARLDAIVAEPGLNTLGAGITNSSLTSVGVLAAPHMTSPVVNSGGISVVAGTSSLQAVTFTTATGSGVLTITSGGIAVTGNSTITGTLGGISTLTATTFVGALTGNASTANILLTPRAINGVNFDGSGPITVTAAAGTLTGAALNATVTASSLTSVGVLASPHMTAAVVDSGGFTVTAGTSSLQAVTCTTVLASSTIQGAGISTQGASAGFTFSDRTAGTNWAWYATGGSSFLFNPTRAENAISVVAASGAVSITAGGLTVLAGTTVVQALAATAISGTSVTATSTISTGSAQAIGWGGASLMFNSSDGVIKFTNNAGTGFSRLQLGGTTGAFPALRRTGGQVDFRLADDSGACDITANNGIFSGFVSATGTSSFQAITGTSGVFSSGVQIGGGATVTKWLTATFSWNLNFTGGNVATTVSVPGAAVGDLVVIDNPFIGVSQPYALEATVSAADTVKLRAFAIDATGSSSTQTIRIFVVKF